MLWYVQNYVVSLLRDKGGANAVEYALIMALVAVFIIAGVLAMSGAIGNLFIRCRRPKGKVLLAPEHLPAPWRWTPIDQIAESLCTD